MYVIIDKPKDFMTSIKKNLKVITIRQIQGKVSLIDVILGATTKFDLRGPIFLFSKFYTRNKT